MADIIGAVTTGLYAEEAEVEARTQEGPYYSEIYAKLQLKVPTWNTMTDVLLAPAREIIKARGPGILKLLYIKATNKDWLLSITADGKTIINTKPFDAIKRDFEVSSYVVADERDGTYIVAVENIPFLGGLVVKLMGKKPGVKVDMVRYELVTLEE